MSKVLVSVSRRENKFFHPLPGYKFCAHFPPYPIHLPGVSKIFTSRSRSDPDKLFLFYSKCVFANSVKPRSCVCISNEFIMCMRWLIDFIRSDPGTVHPQLSDPVQLGSDPQYCSTGFWIRSEFIWFPSLSPTLLPVSNSIFLCWMLGKFATGAVLFVA